MPQRGLQVGPNGNATWVKLDVGYDCVLVAQRYGPPGSDLIFQATNISNLDLPSCTE